MTTYYYGMRPEFLAHILHSCGPESKFEVITSIDHITNADRGSCLVISNPNIYYSNKSILNEWCTNTHSKVYLLEPLTK